ncbi:four-carbon acid sugar kinase family protein [Dermacoccaceae bacterium W4C1]
MSGAMEAPVWGVVADDLTGGADVGAELARTGRPVSLVLDDGIEPPAGDVVLVTFTRAAPEPEAARRTEAAFRALGVGQGRRPYLKVDSTLRGSVTAQIRGALTALQESWSQAYAVVCSALPEQGRLVRDGVLLVHGQPVAAGAAALDPVSPVRTSAVTELLGSARQATAAEGAGGEVISVDAEDEESLAALAEELHQIREVLPVGSAGLIGALLRAERQPLASTGLGRVSRPLVVAGSLHPVSREQLALLAEQRDTRILQPAPQRSDPEQVAALLGEATAQALAPPSSGSGEPQAYDGLVLVGGDTAAAVLHRLGVSAVRMVADGRLDLPCGVIAGGPFDGMPLVTKSGGFGSPDSLVRLIDRLAAGPENEGKS